MSRTDGETASNGTLRSLQAGEGEVRPRTGLKERTNQLEFHDSLMRHDVQNGKMDSELAIVEDEFSG